MSTEEEHKKHLEQLSEAIEWNKKEGNTETANKLRALEKVVNKGKKSK